MRPAFYVYNHHNKARALIEALIAAGWRQTTPTRAQVVFVDVDVNTMRNIIKQYHRRGKKIFIHPHGAMPYLFNTFPGFEPFQHIAANLVIAPGHAEVMRTFEYPHPLEIIGWHLCPLREFQPRAEVKKILFAPIHPTPAISPESRKINADTFRKLLAFKAQKPDAEITVRFLHQLELNGLWHEPGVRYVQGRPNQSYEDIDAADMVVSRGTFLYLAVARGVPALG